jgi:hypothetical protein
MCNFVRLLCIRYYVMLYVRWAALIKLACSIYAWVPTGSAAQHIQSWLPDLTLDA